MTHILQTSDHFCDPPVHSLQQVHILLVKIPELDEVLRVGSHKDRVEEEHGLCQPAGHASFDASEDTVGSLNWLWQ